MRELPSSAVTSSVNHLGFSERLSSATSEPPVSVRMLPSIVVSSFENAENVDIDEARKLLEQADKAMLEADPSSSEYADAQVAQALATGRILAAERRSE